MKINKKFNNIIKEVISNGKVYENERRKTKRLQIPSYTFRHNMSDGFPLLSTKDINYQSVFSELIWFLRGDPHTSFLKANKNPIWDKDAKNWYNKENGTSFNLREYKNITDNKGSGTGCSYPRQWRNYNGEVDQINNVINAMRKDIMGSRIILNAWNPSEINDTALPPCHTGFQIIGVPLSNGAYGFELHWKQRSCDLFLGVPYNIASYAALGVYLQNVTGYEFLTLQSDLKCVHLYENSILAALELTQRPTKSKKVSLNIDFNSTNFQNLELEHFKVENYEPLSKLNVQMLEPIKI